MATIDDFGDTAEPLNNPVLGGPAGWAAAVRDAIMARLPLSGGTLTGELKVPTIALGDDVNLGSSDADGLVVWNETVTQLETVAVGTPTGPTHAATKGYVDSAHVMPHCIWTATDIPVNQNWQQVTPNQVTVKGGVQDLGGGNFRVPAGLYLVTVRVAGGATISRLLSSVDANDGTYGDGQNWIFDWQYQPDSPGLVSGSRILYVPDVIRPTFLFSGGSGFFAAYGEFVRLGATA